MPLESFHIHYDAVTHYTYIHVLICCRCRVYQCTRGSGSGHDCGTLLANAPSNTYALNTATLCVMHALDRVLLPPTTTTDTATATSDASTSATAAAVQTATDAAAAVFTDDSSASSSTDQRHKQMQTRADVSEIGAAVAVVPTVLNVIQSRPELSQFYALLLTAGGLPDGNGKHHIHPLTLTVSSHCIVFYNVAALWSVQL
jgi:hypothetical protein